MKHYTANELQEMPTLAMGQTDSLKVNNGEQRVWLCRCGVEDGMPYDNQVTIETLRDGQWVETAKYAG